MAERMVRTQIYLPPKVHAELKRRAKKHGLTLALQIREALEDYLRRENGAEEDIEPLDLGNLFEILDQLEASGGSGISDSSVNHDKYIYGDPHGEKALERERLRAQLKSQPTVPVKERSTRYKTKKRRITKRKGGRK